MRSGDEGGPRGAWCVACQRPQQSGSNSISPNTLQPCNGLGTLHGPLVPSRAGQGQAESGDIVLAAVYWAPSGPGWCYPTGRCAYLPPVLSY